MIWKVNLIKLFYEEITGLTFTKDSRYLIAACVGGNKIAVRDICALAKDARTYKNQYNTSIVYTSKDINKLMNIFLRLDWMLVVLRYKKDDNQFEKDRNQTDSILNFLSI